MNKEKILRWGYSVLGPLALVGKFFSAETDILPASLEKVLLSDQLYELLLPFSTYFWLDALDEWGKERRELSANSGININRPLVIFGLYSAVELLQEQGLKFPYDSYDPKDFLAYDAGAGLAMIVNELSFSNRK